MTLGDDYPSDAKRKIVSVETLETLTRRDPEQEVQGIALPVLDAVIESVRAVLPDDPVVQAVRGIVSPEQIAPGEPVRAADAMLVAKQPDAGLVPCRPGSPEPPDPPVVDHLIRSGRSGCPAP